jgi:hypothetical protein
MIYHVFELPLNTPALVLQTAITNTGETLVSVVADTINNRFIIVTKP